MWVLIETLWNVKYISAAEYLRNVVRINRNIVECKGICQWVATSSTNSINRNIVECKERCVRVVLYAGPVLIETLWNVKTHKFCKSITRS